MHVQIDGVSSAAPVTAVAPGAAQELSFPTSGEQTVYSAYMYVPALHGADEGRVQRLAQRGLGPQGLNAPQIVVAEALSAAMSTPEAVEQYRLKVLPALE